MEPASQGSVIGMQEAASADEKAKEEEEDAAEATATIGIGAHAPKGRPSFRHRDDARKQEPCDPHAHSHKLKL